MALIKCDACGSDISASAKTCPQCGHPNSKQSPPPPTTSAALAKLFVSILLFVGFMWFVFGGGFRSLTGGMVDNQMADIKSKVAADEVSQYQIAAAQGDKMSKCVQAGFVAAYLQAQDTAEYNTWKTYEKIDCEQAGIKRH